MEGHIISQGVVFADHVCVGNGVLTVQAWPSLSDCAGFDGKEMPVRLLTQPF